MNNPEILIQIIVLFAGIGGVYVTLMTRITKLESELSALQTHFSIIIPKLMDKSDKLYDEIHEIKLLIEKNKAK